MTKKEIIAGMKKLYKSGKLTNTLCPVCGRWLKKVPGTFIWCCKNPAHKINA
jgi:ribosomal protein L37AE/L43A